MATYNPVKVVVYGFNAVVHNERVKNGKREFYCAFSAHGEWIPEEDIKWT